MARYVIRIVDPKGWKGYAGQDNGAEVSHKRAKIYESRAEAVVALASFNDTWKSLARVVRLVPKKKAAAVECEICAHDVNAVLESAALEIEKPAKGVHRLDSRVALAAKVRALKVAR